MSALPSDDLNQRPLKRQRVDNAIGVAGQFKQSRPAAVAVGTKPEHKSVKDPVVLAQDESNRALSTETSRKIRFNVLW